MELTKKVREAIFEIICMDWGVVRLDNIVQALQGMKSLVDPVQVYWILQGDPQHAFVPAGSNDEIEVFLFLP